MIVDFKAQAENLVVHTIPSEIIDLKIIPKKSELFRAIPEPVSEPFRFILN